MMNLSEKKGHAFSPIGNTSISSMVGILPSSGDKCSNGDNYPWYLLCSLGILGDYPLNIHGTQPFAVI